MFRTVPLSIIRSFSLYTQQWQTYMSYRFADSLRTGSGRKFRPDPAHKLSAKLYDIYHSCVYSEKLLIMDRRTVRNMQSFVPKINLTNQCIQLLLLQEYITMHGHLNVTKMPTTFNCSINRQQCVKSIIKGVKCWCLVAFF